MQMTPSVGQAIPRRAWNEALKRRGGIPAAHSCIDEASAASSCAYVCQPHGIPKNLVKLSVQLGDNHLGK